jgi:hypothetical protein
VVNPENQTEEEHRPLQTFGDEPRWSRRARSSCFLFDAHFLTNIHYLYNESSTTKFNTTLNHTYILKKSLVKKHVYLSGCISMYDDLSADVSFSNAIPSTYDIILSNSSSDRGSVQVKSYSVVVGGSLALECEIYLHYWSTL